MNRRILVLLLSGLACWFATAAEQTPAVERAARRAYDGAPPVVGHEDFGIDCVECHESVGIEIEGTGLAPVMPHGVADDLGTFKRCRQCHVFKITDDEFVASSFLPLRQDLRSGKRAYPGAPPRIPHKVFMRERCAACHIGSRARDEIRTPHPERERCQQCHLQMLTTDTFPLQTP